MSTERADNDEAVSSEEASEGAPSAVDAAAAADAEPGMTIDELAERSGTSIRTLRLYQTKALLPPPKIVGRVGYYSAAHINRLVTIDRLQKRGFSLAGIGELIRMFEQGRGIDELLGYERILAAPFSDETPFRVTKAELPVKFPRLADSEEMHKRALSMGLIVPDGDDAYLVPSPNLLDFGAVLVERGVPADVAMRELQNLSEDLGRIASRFIDLFRTYIFPSVVSDDAGVWLPKLAKFEKLYRPALRTLVASLFTREMDRAIKQARKAVERIAGVSVGGRR